MDSNVVCRAFPERVEEVMTQYKIILRDYPNPLYLNSDCYENDCRGIYQPWFRELFSRFDWVSIEKIGL